MEYQMSNQFENMAENTEFFSDFVSIKLGEIVFIDKLAKVLEDNADMKGPHLSNKNGSIYLQGSMPWDQEKIAQFKKIEAEKSSNNLSKNELNSLKNLLAKYPREALKILSEQ